MVTRSVSWLNYGTSMRQKCARTEIVDRELDEEMWRVHTHQRVDIQSRCR
jgi:hypothetical protein